MLISLKFIWGYICTYTSISEATHGTQNTHKRLLHWLSEGWWPLCLYGFFTFPNMQLIDLKASLEKPSKLKDWCTPSHSQLAAKLCQGGEVVYYLLFLEDGWSCSFPALLCTDLYERRCRCKGYIPIILACSCLDLAIPHLRRTWEKDYQGKDLSEHHRDSLLVKEAVFH